MTSPSEGYKTVGAKLDSIYGSGRWTPGKPRSVKLALEPCSIGIHYCRRDQMVFWLGPRIFRFEDLSPDETIDAGDKMVTRKGRITTEVKTWNDRTARLFAADCAEAVVHLIPQSHRDPFTNAISAARLYARSEINDAARDAAWAAARDAARAAARDAARDAAWAAARDAAWAAARDAARDAAWAAARDAAWAAARDAARDAAWAAARDAARDAARAGQSVILFEYLEGTRS